METIIELLDREQVLNIISVLAFKPKNVVYICGRDEDYLHIRQSLQSFYNTQCPEVTVHFYTIDTGDFDAINDCIEEVTRRHPEHLFDVSGGGELLLLLAIGAYCRQNSSAAIAYYRGNGNFANAFGCKYELEREPEITIDGLLRLAGGMFAGNNHYRPEDINGTLIKTARAISEICLVEPERWTASVRYLQYVTPREIYNRPSRLDVSAEFSAKPGELECDEEILSVVTMAGAVKDLHISRNKQRVEFEYADKCSKLLMTDAGSWLEIMTYAALIGSGGFNEVQLSVIVDWNRKRPEYDDVTNEIDCIAVRGLRSLFISCKVKKSVTPDDLYEISVQADRFGGIMAVPVIVTTAGAAKGSARVLKRADEMGVRVVGVTAENADRLGEMLAGLL